MTLDPQPDRTQKYFDNIDLSKTLIETDQYRRYVSGTVEDAVMYKLGLASLETCDYLSMLFLRFTRMELLFGAHLHPKGDIFQNVDEEIAYVNRLTNEPLRRDIYQHVGDHFLYRAAVDPNFTLDKLSVIAAKRSYVAASLIDVPDPPSPFFLQGLSENFELYCHGMGEAAISLGIRSPRSHN